MKLDQSTYVAVLEILHQKVIPNLASPVSLMDFFVDAYNSGLWYTKIRRLNKHSGIKWFIYLDTRA